MSDMLLLEVLILFFLEIIEANLIKGNTFTEIIMYLKWTLRNNPILFVILHSSTIYVVYFASNLEVENIWLNIMLVMKMIDLLTRFYMFTKIADDGTMVVNGTKARIDIPLGNSLRYSSAVIYPTLMYLAIS